MNFKKSLALLMLALGIVGVSSCEENNIDDNNPVDTGDNGGNTEGGNTGESDATALATAKANARTELQAYALSQRTTLENGVTAGTYDSEAVSQAVTSFTEKITSGIAAINAATTTEGVTSALNAAKAEVLAIADAIINPADPVDPATQEHNVSTAAEFMEMLKSSVGIYKLTADIDLSTQTFSLSTICFKGTIDGQGHKVTFNRENIISVAKGSGLFYDELDGATIKNLTIENVNISAGGDTVALFGNGHGDITFENILITGAKAAFSRYSGLLLAKTGSHMTLKNVAAVGYEITAGDYSAALIGDMTTSLDANSNNASGYNSTLNAENILLDGKITGPSQCVAAVVGFIDSKDATTPSSVVVDGVVLNGEISGGKNVGGVVGSFKRATGTLSIKNVLALDLSITSTVSVTTPLDAKIGVAYGLSNTADVTTENIKAINKSTKLIYDTNNDGISEGDLSSLLPETVEVDAAVAPNANFTIESNQIKLGNLASIQMPEKVLTSDVALGTISKATSESATASVTNQTVTFSGLIGYYHKVVAGFAGNGVAISITAANGVDTTGATIQIGNETATAYTSGEALYVPVTDLASTQTITVVWNETANPQTYTVAFSEATLETAPVYGAIQNNDSNTALQATANNDSVTYTAGEIAWDTTQSKAGNYVTVSVAKPTWVTDASGVSVTGGTIVGTVAQDATSIDVLVSVTASGAKVSVKWNNATDAKDYTIVIDGATLQVNPNSSNITVITAIEIATAAGIALDDTGKNSPIANGRYAGVIVVGSGTKRANSSTVSIEVAKAGGSSLQITTTGAATITISYSSTSGTNSSDIRLTGTGVVDSGVKTMTGTTPTDAVYEVSAAGTYTIESDGGTNTGRGCRIYSITIELA